MTNDELRTAAFGVGLVVASCTAITVVMYVMRHDVVLRKQGPTPMSPVSFSDVEFDRICAAAAMLQNEKQRSDFLKIVGNRLSDLPYQAQTGDIENAIAFALGTFGLARA